MYTEIAVLIALILALALALGFRLGVHHGMAVIRRGCDTNLSPDEADALDWLINKALTNKKESNP